MIKKIPPPAPGNSSYMCEDLAFALFVTAICNHTVETESKYVFNEGLTILTPNHCQTSRLILDFFLNLGLVPGLTLGQTWTVETSFVVHVSGGNICFVFLRFHTTQKQ